MKRKKIGLCHGVFDLIHYGHILHFENAKSKVDWLVVSVTKDEFVNKGPGRPYFVHNERIKFLKNLKIIDEVILSENVSAKNSLQYIKPDIFFKGIEYKNEKNKLNLFNDEKKFCLKNNIEIFYTDDKIYSSSSLINKFQQDEKIKKNIKLLKKKFTFNSIFEKIEKAKKKKIIVLGDPILDKYRYVSTIGTSSKAPSIAALNEYEELYKGGSIAVAEMLSAIGFTVELVCYKSPKNKLHNKISKNIKVHSCFSHNDFPIIERIVDHGRGVKLFQGYNSNNINVSKLQEKKIKKIIQKLNLANNLFLIIDFGYNFLTRDLINYIDKEKINYSLNCHLNALNLGSNHFKKYRNFNYITFNKREFDINFREKETFDLKIKEANKIIKKPFAVTLGKSGSIFLKNKKKYFFPAIEKNIVDPVGCGDAFFSISSAIYNTTKDPILSNFLGNVYAGLHGMVVCNKEFTDNKKFYNTIKTLMS